MTVEGEKDDFHMNKNDACERTSLVQLGISEWEFGTYPVLLYLTCVHLRVRVCVCVRVYIYTQTLCRNTRIHKWNY